ncbi:MAG: PAS domain S-box protein, partial [Planctomycetaceae bacterium]
MHEPHTLRILLIDDDEETFVITRELLREINGRPVVLEWTGEAEQGYEVILRQEHEVYLVNYRLGADDGLDLLRRARVAGCKAPILILTGQTDEEIDQLALKAGASDYLAKDVYDVSRLEHAIRYAIERHGLLRDLERERYLLHSLMESLPDHVYFKDRASRFVRISRAMANWFGLQDPGDAVGKTDADFFTEEHARQARDDEQQLMESGEPVIRKEEKETWPAGRATWVSTNKMPLRDREGNVVGTIGISRNITDEKLAFNALKRSELLNRLIVATTLDAFVAMDSSGHIVNWNPQAENTFGWKFEEAVHQPVADLLVPERYRTAFRSRLGQFLQTGDGDFLDDRLELAALHRSGKEFPVEVTIAPIEQEGDWLFSAFVHDISRRKQAEHELRESKEAAEQASRAKSDFLANMSHEIRTPMNAILGMTELVLDTELAITQREYLSMVLESGDVLLNLINDILDFSKIEAGRFELDPFAFNLRDSLGDTLKSLAIRADRMNLELACHIDTKVPRMIVGDAARLRQIVVNLVGNAIKFTERGEIVLHVDVKQSDDETVLLHFAVADTGIGIPPEKLETVFDAFQQADTSTTRRYGGTGLGLTICSRLVGLMSGNIWAESRPGQGSTFHFTARFELAETSSRPYSQRIVQGTRVLVVDNHTADRLVLVEMLRNWGMLVSSVSSVDAAMHHLRSARDNNSPFALVVSDLNMPVRNGFDLARDIQSDITLAETVFLMLTSDDQSADRHQASEPGVTAYLQKPVSQSSLLDAIVTTLDVTSTSPHENRAITVTFDPHSVRLPPLQVLLVEDSLVNQKLALGLLNRWGHSVTVAANG